MKAIELFAGIGGASIAMEWAGIETVAFCEKDPFCQKILNKHWPNIPIFEDINQLSKQSLIDKGVDTDGIDVISGGFPCQPFSVAGKRKGRADDRDLWPEMFRIIRELKPTWVVGENVANFVNMELDRSLTDLENAGYEAQSFIIPAAAVGAPHKRERCFVVAHSKSKQSSSKNEQKFSQAKQMQLGRRIIPFVSRSTWKICKPPICGVDDGIPDRVDRMRVLGNAVMPIHIYPVFATISAIEKS